MSMPIVAETHIQGSLQIENLGQIEYMNLMDCDFGLQAHDDGRVWVCINGIAFLRFKPHRKESGV